VADASFASSPEVRLRMQRQRAKDTAPELLVRQVLHGLGLRYRIHRRPLPKLRRTADIVFGPSKVAVFIDGCFWHGCPDCYDGRVHKTNDWYWPAKIERNRTRDADTDQRLHEAGWLPLRVWEHQDATEAARAIAQAVESRRPRDTKGV
jgi:DNA mismatch endonuclease (patch repair protein)